MEPVLEKVTEKCEQVKKEMKAFSHFIQEMSVVEDETMNVDERIKAAEIALGEFGEKEQKKADVRKVLVELRKEMECALVEIINEEKRWQGGSGEYNSIVKRLLLLERQSAEERKKPLLTQIDDIEKSFKEKEQHLQTMLKPLPFNGSLEEDEVEQIQKWSFLKIESVIFDSNLDDWSVNSSVFSKKIANKSKVAVIVEDKNGNKFGGVVFNAISGVDEWNTDPRAFLFTLKSNGRTEGMEKYQLLHKYAQYAFHCFTDDYEALFYICNGGIHVFKKDQGGSGCNYNRTENTPENVFCDGATFTPKRITVLQLASL
ncbi:hypothetical protein EIN_146090 [Entamoeba invadens IP1]|uniref:TLDc domain-containing protein n=1 Tax=Entamoeba invadens IP1 TaxID=370355 RepID=L7FLY9_ENTIV|nr:hypothetical protein EIN_146090 [Entamoeba invadens IP1]ELP87615.1 hypothetical protein EIN_146090 [Entamoeba invadens IP1]|eukprot:XP_004254386.1 hypothetical protein EIN_146090 [Entamoeba invadens IP1]